MVYGSFEFTSLSPGNYSLCIRASDLYTDLPQGYQSQCYDGIPWDEATTTEAAAGATGTPFVITPGEHAAMDFLLTPNAPHI